MPPFDPQKHPFTQSLNWWAKAKTAEAEALLPKSVPASVVSVDPTNTIVTIKVEMDTGPYKLPTLTVPVFGPQYVRWPIQKGDKGVFLAADYYLGGMSGLGGGVAKMAINLPSLSSGIWIPMGNVGFTPTDDPNKTVIYGPDGVIIRTASGPSTRDVTADCKAVVDHEGFKVYIGEQLKMIVDANGIRFYGESGSGFGIDITAIGTLIDGVNFLPHIHANVQTGPDPTGPVIP